jgi:hypothetical protein
MVFHLGGKGGELSQGEPEVVNGIKQITLNLMGSFQWEMCKVLRSTSPSSKSPKAQLPPKGLLPLLLVSMLHPKV